MQSNVEAECPEERTVEGTEQQVVESEGNTSEESKDDADESVGSRLIKRAKRLPASYYKNQKYREQIQEIEQENQVNLKVILITKCVNQVYKFVIVI